MLNDSPQLKSGVNLKDKRLEFSEVSQMSSETISNFLFYKSVVYLFDFKYSK